MLENFSCKKIDKKDESSNFASEKEKIGGKKLKHFPLFPRLAAFLFLISFRHLTLAMRLIV